MPLDPFHCIALPGTTHAQYSYTQIALYRAEKKKDGSWTWRKDYGIGDYRSYNKAYRLAEAEAKERNCAFLPNVRHNTPVAEVRFIMDVLNCARIAAGEVSA